MSVRPSRSTRVFGGCAALALAGAFGAGPVLVPAAAAEPGPKVLFKITDARINESSGLAASTRHPGVVYTHNDSGGVAQIFALAPDGSVRAVLSLAGAGARDWEGMALGKDDRGRPAIFVADIGDNLGGAWPYVTLYRIPEPAELRSQTIRATAFRLKYADGPRNAETVMINPRTNRLYIASKLFSGALYEGPERLRTGTANTLHKIGGAPPMATDGAFAPDGSTCVIRTYFGARLYSVGPDGRPGKSITSVSLPFQSQGESVTYTPDGRSLLAGSEGRDQPVYRVPVPGKEQAPQSASPSAKGADKGKGTDKEKGGGKDRADEGHRDPSTVRVGLFLALAIAAAACFGLLRKGRRGGR
ncbi:hypothetical protein [Actinomadura roseirufa]|uniref:hypothetical protein n=1 Tax=Actinomadura roseirufa TaxID=2094049 RepID=UPI0010413C03|nr:hypothetical protein [Actinomadura roseirufa]